jgi:hypothetical protein
MEKTNHFLQWLGEDYKVTSIQKTVLGKTMTTNTITLSDGRVFVEAERALVSYDGGFYMSYRKGDETDKVIETIVWNWSWNEGA